MCRAARGDVQSRRVRDAADGALRRTDCRWRCLFLDGNAWSGVAADDSSTEPLWWRSWMNLSKLVGSFHDEDGSVVTWTQWFNKQYEFLGRPRISPIAWMLTLAGGLYVLVRRKSEGVRWLG